MHAHLYMHKYIHTYVKHKSHTCSAGIGLGRNNPVQNHSSLDGLSVTEVHHPHLTHTHFLHPIRWTITPLSHPTHYHLHRPRYPSMTV